RRAAPSTPSRTSPAPAMTRGPSRANCSTRPASRPSPEPASAPSARTTSGFPTPTAWRRSPRRSSASATSSATCRAAKRRNRANAVTLIWPDIPYEPWRETCSALHLYTQIVGKYRLARTPWVNHSWHATLYVNARGLTTSIVPDGAMGVEIGFDLLDHAIIGATMEGRRAGFPLGPMSVAEFDARFLDLIGGLG